MRLDYFSNTKFNRGASKTKEFLWLICSWLLFSSALPGSGWRTNMLRLFGASIGKRVIFKPRVRIKFPWFLTVGNHCWIGENVWIDNLAKVSFGDHVCVSQGVYFCTGSHDWTKFSFDLITKPILIESHAWIAAKSIVAPGIKVGAGAVLLLGSVATHSLEPWGIYAGSPAVRIKMRRCDSETLC